MISNATPLICLGKLNKLELLRTLYGTVLIPEAVKREVIDNGIELHEPDAVLVQKAVADGWIIVRPVASAALLKDMGIDQGEQEAISLALHLKEKEILLDQTHARVAAEMVGLTPRGTLHVLFRALKEKLITSTEYRALLEKMAQIGFRMSQELYLTALRMAEEIKK